MDLTKATAQDFQASVGDSFICATSDGDVTLTLDNIKILPESGRRPGSVAAGDTEVPPRTPFALTFEGPREPMLGQSIYVVRSEKLGGLEFFLSPFHQDESCVLYETTFN